MPADASIIPPDLPVAGQMELFAFATSTPAGYINTYDWLDTVQTFSQLRERKSAAPDIRKIVLRGLKLPLEVQTSPAVLTVDGVTRYVMPGKREEFIERAIRKLASDNADRLGVETERDAATGTTSNHVTVTFRLSQLRSTLKRTGHEFKLSELREGLIVLQRARMDFKKEALSPTNTPDSRLRRVTDGTTFLQRVQTIEDPADKTGQRVFYKVTLNPIASLAIMEKSYRLIDFPTLMRLKPDLSRWLYVRLANRYKHASHEAMWRTEQQYHIAWSTIADESGINVSNRMRENIDKVNQALEELKAKDVIEKYTSKTNRGRVSGTRGPAQIIDAVWNIIPSPKFIDDAVKSNKRLQIKDAPAR